MYKRILVLYQVPSKRVGYTYIYTYIYIHIYLHIYLTHIPTYIYMYIIIYTYTIIQVMWPDFIDTLTADDDDAEPESPHLDEPIVIS